MVMIFSLKKVREYLLTNGRVYTFRLKEHKTGPDWITDRRGGKKIADVLVHYAKRVYPLDLLPWVNQSGFENLGEWIATIFEVNKIEMQPTPYGYLHEVTIRNRVSERGVEGSK